jgi:hypothetical protein
MSERITRQTLIAASVDAHLRSELFNRLEYPESQVEVLESFPHDVFDGPLDHSYIAYGFDVDDGGAAGEMGSDLVVRVHDAEIFVFAHSPAFGRNLGPTIRDTFDVRTIPLLDVREQGRPEIDRLVVESASADRQPIPDPKPWEENVWLVTVRLSDEYYASGW